VGAAMFCVCLHTGLTLYRSVSSSQPKMQTNIRSVLKAMNGNAFTTMLEVHVASPPLAEMRTLLKVPQPQLDGTMPEFSESHPFADVPELVVAVAPAAVAGAAANEPPFSESEPGPGPGESCDLEKELAQMLEQPSLNGAGNLPDETIAAEPATRTGLNDAPVDMFSETRESESATTEPVAETVPIAAGIVADREEVPAANHAPNIILVPPPAADHATDPEQASRLKRMLGVTEGAPPAKAARGGRGRGRGKKL